MARRIRLFHREGGDARDRLAPSPLLNPFPYIAQVKNFKGLFKASLKTNQKGLPILGYVHAQPPRLPGGAAPPFNDGLRSRDQYFIDAPG